MDALKGRTAFLDFIVAGALRRSFALTQAFFTLAEAENFLAAAPLVRLQLDNTLRGTAAIVVSDTREYIDHLVKHLPLNRLKDKHGNRLTDAHLARIVATDFPWVVSLYAYSSRFIHLSEAHLLRYDSGGICLPERDKWYSEVAYVELIESFVVASRLFFAFARRGIRTTRSQAGLPPEPELKRWRKVPRYAYHHIRRRRLRFDDMRLIQRRFDIARLPRWNPRQSKPFYRWLRGILEGHGLLTCRLYDDWVVVDGRLPGIKCEASAAAADDGDHKVQLDVSVSFSDAVLCESFAGRGSSALDALTDAFRGFRDGSMHVLLAAVWDRPNPAMVTVEPWDGGEGDWRLFVGHPVVRCEDPNDINVPHDFHSLLRAVLRERRGVGTIHWVRLFYGDTGEHRFFEALLDNEPVPMAERVLPRLPWKRSGRLFTVRAFAMIRREDRSVGLWSGMSTKPTA